MEIKEMKLYRINTNYVKYLQAFDINVKNNEKDNSIRPYIGVVLTVNNCNYYIPVCSKRKKHYNMYDSIDFIKLGEGKNLISVLNVNNMIPVPYKYITLIDIDNEPDNQKIVLKKEAVFIRKKKEQIIKSAKDVYHIKTNHPKDNPKLSMRCADFKLLEQKMKEYITQN